MVTIKSLRNRKILNSHAGFTTEFIVELSDGSKGCGAAPQGETIGIYEDHFISSSGDYIVERINKDGLIGEPINQERFDNYLDRNVSEFGRNNVCGISLAFFDALTKTHSFFDLFEKNQKKLNQPHICLNILNGGWHAYTNPVLSDFHEYILVSKSNDPTQIIPVHNEIQREVKDQLLNHTKTVVAKNPVNSFRTPDNRECIEFLLEIIEKLGVEDEFDLMIDASGGDLLTESGYRLSITDNSLYSKEEFLNYWHKIIKDYPLRFLEDPFHEKDFDNWRNLTTSQDSCYIIGDNFYSTDADRIIEGANNHYTHGVIIKPNQAGSVTAVKRAIEATLQSNQIGITSHRSISTESTFISLLTCIYDINYIKIGPLFTDYSSIIRYNEIIRLSEIEL